MIAEVTMVSSLIKSLPLIVVIMTVGVDGLQDWGVNYSPSYVCALKGSTVKISCTLTHPYGYETRTAFWTKTVVNDGEPHNFCSDPKKRSGIWCNSENKNTSSITLTAVTEADKHIYYCRFTTDKADGKWTGISGVQLDVTDLQVETQQSVNVGDSVTLTCKSSCSLPEQTTFIWYKETQRITRGIVKVNQLHLWSVRSSDIGNYRCAVRGYERLRSPVVYLYVDWVDGLRDSGVNYSPSYVCALKGSTVKISCTLTHSYKLIKGFWTKAVVTDGESPDLCSDPEKRRRVQCLSANINTYSITLMNVTEADKRVYYCRITDSWQKSWTVIPGSWLDVTDLQVETRQRVKEGDSVTLTCKSSCSLPEQTTFIWYRNTQRITDRTENQLHLQSVSRSDEGNYQCEIRGNNHHLISPVVHLNVEYPPQNVSVWVSVSGVIVEGDSVTLNCSSDSNPPALNFSWFKENETSAVGSGQSFSISSFNSSFSGRFYCEAQNKYGSQRSASVSLTVKGVQRDVLLTVSGIVAGIGGLIFIIIIIIIIIFIVFIKKKRRDGGAEVIRQNQESLIDRSAETASTNDDPLYSQVSANQRDDLYSNIKAKKPERSGRKQTETSGDVTEVQYATVYHFKNKDMKTEEYDCFETHHPSDANRSENVIYSSVNLN
ncbi:B-cell receptor CD22-like [Siphateles boraxobius]|uniref:B-cell receptor CD22-like n=1 Tax=Siphateles boraxobius TaxID=180520 RepID=UPI00406382E5